MNDTAPVPPPGNSSGCAAAAGVLLVVIFFVVAVLLAWPYLSHARHQPPGHTSAPADTLLPPPEHSDLGPASER